jgi:hypothetical protein
MAWLDALLGQIYVAGVKIPLSKGLNFSTGLIASLNPTTKVIDVTQDVPGVAAQVIAALPAASETTASIVEFASASEANGLAVTDRALSPARLPLASDTQRGLVEFATLAEAQALTDTTRAVTPGAIPEASTSQRGITRYATAAEQETASAADRAVTPSVQHRHPSAAKAWVRCGVTGNIIASYGVSSVTDTGTGVATVNFDVTFPVTNNYMTLGWVSVGTGNPANNTTAMRTMRTGTPNNGSIALSAYDSAASPATADPDTYFAAFYGDQ